MYLGCQANSLVVVVDLEFTFLFAKILFFSIVDPNFLWLCFSANSSVSFFFSPFLFFSLSLFFLLPMAFVVGMMGEKVQENRELSRSCLIQPEWGRR